MKTGHIVIGHVLDCNKKHLEKALKDYDRQLYLKWNPDKDSGRGLWEVRRKPDHMTAVPKWEYGDIIVFELQYVENDLVHHVMDVPYLNYQILTRIREMDAWNTKNWAAELDYRADKARDKAFDENRENLRYAIKQHRRAFEDLREHIRSGKNPAEFLRGTW